MKNGKNDYISNNDKLLSPDTKVYNNSINRMGCFIDGLPNIRLTLFKFVVCISDLALTVSLLFGRKLL
jgi:hypothetical protein